MRNSDSAFSCSLYTSSASGLELCCSMLAGLSSVDVDGILRRLPFSKLLKTPVTVFRFFELTGTISVAAAAAAARNRWSSNCFCCALRCFISKVSLSSSSSVPGYASS